MSIDKKTDTNGANLGFEQKMWLAADKLRSNMDAAEYKHVVLGLIFLKYISDAFTEVYEELIEPARKTKFGNFYFFPTQLGWPSFLPKLS